MARKLTTSLPLFESDAVPVIDLVLRPYQDRTVRLLRMHNAANKKRVLCVAPTRAGKTIIIVAITKQTKLPVIVVAHRMELIDQCVNQLARAGLTNVGVMRGDDERENPNASVQVCSIATLARREKPFKDQRCIIFIDEAHRSCSDSYVQHVFEAYPDAFIVGFTATPCRLDGKPLGEFYEVLEVACTYQELFKRPDWLVPPDIYASPVRADLSKVRTIAGDFDEGALAEVMHRQEIEGNVVDHWLKLAHMHPVFEKGVRLHGILREGPRRATFLFASGIDHSLSICGRFEAAGVRIVHLDGSTPEDHRRAALRDLAARKIEIISNVNILLEGVDVPEAKCVSHARPTQSITLWRQSACRVLTPHGGITPLILDHAGNFDRLGAPHEDLNWSLTGKPSRRSSAPATRVCPQCFAYVLAGRATCPYCGMVFSSADTGDRKPPEETNDELEKRKTDPIDLRKEFFDKQLEFARARGFKPGFASAKFKERYKDWPPREWSELAKWEYAKDAKWQYALEVREKRRAAEKEAEERAERSEVEAARAELAEQVGDETADAFVNAEDPAGDDDSFAGWVEQQGITVHKHRETQ